MMRALWLEEQRLSFRQDIPVPVPGEGEVLVRVILAGICSTDLELMRGYYPFTGIPGHEFVGRVVSSPGDVSWLDKRVVGEINIACGICETCKSGLPRHCEQRKTLGIHAWNGVFAEYLVLPYENLHVVPSNLPEEIAVFTEPLAAACEILEQTEIRSRDRVLLIGAGRLGQLVAMVFKLIGCQLEVVARYPNQIALLTKLDISMLSENSLGSRKYDIVIEATGSPDGLTLACKAVRPRGRIILKSTYHGTASVNFSAVVVDEVTLIGSRCGPFPVALKLLSEGTLDPRPLIDTFYSLDQGVAAFERASQPGVLKVLLQPSDAET